MWLEAATHIRPLRPAMSSGDSTIRLEQALNSLLQGDDDAAGRAGGKSLRGVTRHKRSGRWESHVWHNRAQLYVGGWTSERAAARAFDLVCLRTRGAAAVLNFPVVEYAHLIPLLADITNQALVALLRRRSKGWSRGKSRFRGVTQHRSGRFEARIGSRQSKQACARPPIHAASGVPALTLPCHTDVYLGLFPSELEAAHAYDIAALDMCGPAALTNFPASSYAARQPVLEGTPTAEPAARSSIRIPEKWGPPLLAPCPLRLVPCWPLCVPPASVASAGSGAAVTAAVVVGGYASAFTPVLAASPTSGGAPDSARSAIRN